MPRLFIRTTTAAFLAGVACASTRPVSPPRSRIRAATRFVPRVATKARPECAGSRGETRDSLWAVAELDPWLTSGESTLTDLNYMRRTVVQVNDYYFDSRRIDPARMLAAMMQALADRSDGFLRFEADQIVTAAGDRKRLPWPVETIWHVPMAVREIGEFLLRRLPPGHVLRKGRFAEVVMTNALLATLDPYSVLLSPMVWAGLRKRIPADAAIPSGPPGIGGTSAEDLSARFKGRASIIVRPGSFGVSSAGAIRNAVEKALAAGVSGVVLDLRENGGGLLEATLEVADLFLARGTIVTLNAKASAEATGAIEDGLASERVKLVVLVDSATSSGAEILAGTLRFGDRALLIGETTSGNGLIQVLYDFPNPDSSASPGLKLSIAEALLPGDRSFDALGIAPDVEVTSSSGGARATPSLCAPVGETLAAVHYRPGEPDPVLALANRILELAASASRSDLIAAAKAAAASPSE
jgi:Peptidase family S41